MENPRIVPEKRKKSNPHANLLEKKQKQESKGMANLFNRITVAKLSVPPKFYLSRCRPKKIDQLCKGKSVVEPSNNATDHMDIVQATGIFPEDIVMEILIRLPVRSLLRFKCVSKVWKVLISDPYFKRKHLNRAKSDQKLQKFLIAKVETEDMFSFYSSSVSSVHLVEDEEKLYFPWNLKISIVMVLCCCDGLILLAIFDRSNNKGAQHLVLWNPSTRESIELPKLPLGGCVCGLGYDTTSDDYKILAINLNGYACDKLSSEVLALKSGSWRIRKYPTGIQRVFGLIHSGMDSLAFVHGAFHWLGSKGYGCDYTILSFNISNEVYGEIAFSEEMRYILETKKVSKRVEHGISELGGMLCFYSSYTNGVYYIGEDGDPSQKSNGVDGTYKLWVMKEYGVKESWRVLFTIQDPNFFYSAIPKYMYADGEVLLCLRHAIRTSCVYRTSKGPFDLWPLDSIMRRGIAYTETLISPKFAYIRCTQTLPLHLKKVQRLFPKKKKIPGLGKGFF